jgi:hypothetical protein
MSRIGLGAVLARGWMVVVAVLVVAGAGITIYRWHGIFGARGDTAADSAAAGIVDFNPKRVLFEVFGAPGATATINYLDVNAVPRHVDDVALPWTYDTTTTQPAVFAQLAAQGDGASLGCRITIDGVIKDQRTVNTMGAYTFCLDKSG